jgi:Zn-finger nucleic acid-binding protein
MQEHRYKGVPRVLVDECYGCRGLFLDPGELRAIRDALGELALRQSKVEHLLKHDVLFRRELDEEAARNARAHALTTVCRALTRKMLGWPSF